jgi:hypothetical protein
LLAAALAIVMGNHPASAQPAEPVAEAFTTADGVKLHGLFHQSPKPQPGDPVVVLLYAPGPDRSMTRRGDWDGLAQRLTRDGFHVFRFDWRGHGKSTDIADPPQFWLNSWTGPVNAALIKGANRKPLKNDLSAKDIDPKYFPAYVTDLAAVRTHLDQKNDLGNLNTSSIYVIAANEAASLAIFWVAADWVRPAVHPMLAGGATYAVVPSPGIAVNPEAGRDFAGLVMLSGTRPERAPALSPKALQVLVASMPKIRENNPMLFLYGPEDKRAADQAKFFFHDVMAADPVKGPGSVKPLEQTFLRPLENAKGLSGPALLGNNDALGTEDLIVKYLTARQKDRGALVSKRRNYAAPYAVDLRYFGVVP